MAAALLLAVPAVQADLAFDDADGDVAESAAASAAGAQPAGADLDRVTIAEEDAYVAFHVRLGDLTAFEGRTGVAGTMDLTFPGLEAGETVLLRATHGSAGGWSFLLYISGPSRSLQQPAAATLDRANDTIVLRLPRFLMADPAPGATWGPFLVATRLGPAQDQQPNCMLDHCDSASSVDRTLGFAQRTGTGVRVAFQPMVLEPNVKTVLRLNLTFPGPDTDPATPEPPTFALSLEGEAAWNGTLERATVNFTTGQPGRTINVTFAPNGPITGPIRLNITEGGRTTMWTLPITVNSTRESFPTQAVQGDSDKSSPAPVVLPALAIVAALRRRRVV